MRQLCFALLLLLAAAAPDLSRDRGPGVAVGDGIAWRVAGYDSFAYGLPGAIEVRVAPA